MYNLATMTTKKAIQEDFAVIETGGKQYVVSAGDVLDVELLGEFEEGAKIEFDKVLLRILVQRQLLELHTLMVQR